MKMVRFIRRGNPFLDSSRARRTLRGVRTTMPGDRLEGETLENPRMEPVWEDSRPSRCCIVFGQRWSATLLSYDSLQNVNTPSSLKRPQPTRNRISQRLTLPAGGIPISCWKFVLLTSVMLSWRSLPTLSDHLPRK